MTSINPYRHFSKGLLYPVEYEEFFEMLSEICNYCRGNTVEGIYAKRKMIDKGGKYKYQHGAEITFNCVANNTEFVSSMITHYEDTNSYKQEDNFKETTYAFKIIKDGNKKYTLADLLELRNYIKAKVRVIRIHKILNSK